VRVSGGAWADGPVTLGCAGDPALPVSTILGTGDRVAVDLDFEPLAADDDRENATASENVPPASAGAAEGMSEVEKLKAARRQANAAKRAAAEAAAAGRAEEATAPPTSGSPPPPPPPVADAGPLAQLSEAEAKAEALSAEMGACARELEVVREASALDGLSRRVAACAGLVGQLQGLMDEIDLGELDDARRADARARRKAIHARVEGEFEPAKNALSGAVRAAKARLV
jgi:hypothetical protein